MTESIYHVIRGLIDRDLNVSLWWGLCAYCVLNSSWINFSRSLKHPNEQIELSMSVSTAEIDGMTCVWTTSIMGSSSSSSLFPPAVTHGCLLISESWNVSHYKYKFVSYTSFPWCRSTHRQSFLGINFNHASQKVLTVGRDKMRYVEDASLHFLQQLS